MKSELVYGIVTESTVGFAKVRFPDMGDIVSDFLPVVKMRAAGDEVSFPLAVEELVACVMYVGDDNKPHGGVILGALNNDEDTPEEDAAVGKNRTKYSDGAYTEYDKAAHKMTVSVPGTGTVLLKNGSLNFEIGGTKFKMNSAGDGLKAVLTDILTQLELLTIGSFGTPPANVAFFTAIKTRVGLLLG